MASPTSTPNSLSFSLFLNGKSPPEFAEIDRVCLSWDFFNHHFCIHKVLPIYFHFTRNNEKVLIAKLKQMFCCGANLIYRAKNAVEERKPICVPKRGNKPIRNDPALRRLVDELTSANGHVSDAELSTILRTSRSTVNNIRHDLKYKYKALRHGPVLSERQVGARLVFCRDNINRDWTAVMFTDESRVSTSPDSPVKWWVKWGEQIYIESEKFPASIMVWGESFDRGKRILSNALSGSMRKRRRGCWSGMGSTLSLASVARTPFSSRMGRDVIRLCLQCAGSGIMASGSLLDGLQTHQTCRRLSRSGQL